MGLNEFLPPPPLNPSFPMGPSSQTSPDSWVVIRGFLISIYIYIVLCKFTLFLLVSRGKLMKAGAELSYRITNIINYATIISTWKHLLLFFFNSLEYA